MASSYLHITDGWLRANMSVSKLLDSIEAGVECFSAREEGGVTQPVRTVIQDKPRTGHFSSAIAHIDCQEVFVSKMFSHIPKNAERGAPVTHSLLAMFDAKQGQLVALVDGTELTRLHQSATAAAASRQLAPPNSDCLALLVTSARDAEALLASHRLVMKDLSKVNVCAPRGSREDAESFAASLRESPSAKGLEITAFASVEPAVTSAHVICSSCPGANPILESNWIRQTGAHVNSLGSFLPSLREVSEELVSVACVVVDSRPAADKDSGDLKAAGVDVSAACEVGELVGCRRKCDGSASKLTLFSAVGLAVQDGMAARLALKTMTEAKIRDVNCAKS